MNSLHTLLSSILLGVLVTVMPPIAHSQVLQDFYMASNSLKFDHRSFVLNLVKDFVNRVPDFATRTEYFYQEVDLNKDGTQEIILLIFSPTCGNWECSGYILQKQGSQYRTIGRISVMSSGGELVAVQPTTSNGYMDITTQIYNPRTQTSRWVTYQFDGNTYRNIPENANSRPGQIILNARRGEGFRLQR